MMSVVLTRAKAFHQHEDMGPDALFLEQPWLRHSLESVCPNVGRTEGVPAIFGQGRCHGDGGRAKRQQFFPWPIRFVLEGLPGAQGM